MKHSLRETCLKRLDGIKGPALWVVDLDGLGDPALRRLPISIRILLESVVRRLGRPGFAESSVRPLAAWRPERPGNAEFPFLPARVLLQDFTGVPCVVDLAALRSALHRRGGDPSRIEPQIPVDLVIDHSVQLDEAGTPGALDANLIREFERNAERYEFLRWGQNAFRNLRVLPPGLGICHQVNMEYLATCVRTETDEQGRTVAFPDSLVGTDSHTVMINSMGVLGWGVGGIEAEAAMLGLPIPMLPPPVTGVRLVGRIPASANATDLALTVTARLRERGVVGHFVEFFGPGVDSLSLADRAPAANMAPEYGATMGFFPIDAATLRYLRDTGRTEEQIALVEAVTRSQGFWRDSDYAPETTAIEEIDLSALRATVAGPRRPQEQQELAAVPGIFEKMLTRTEGQGFGV
ncbi:MAG: aconitase family protein, partial [Kiritimatiellia bacterium]|nr:aconitase family protein [Kiritimatiellia bacterium]